MKTKQIRRSAERLFVRDVKTLAQISAELGVPLRSLARWSRRGEWMRKRREWQHESPRAALDILKRQREKQMAAIRDNTAAAAPEAIDALNKISLVIEKLESHVEAIGPMLDTLERFAEFVGARADAEECAVLYKWTEKFLDEQRRKYS